MAFAQNGYLKYAFNMLHHAQMEMLMELLDSMKMLASLESQDLLVVFSISWSLHLALRLWQTNKFKVSVASF